MFYGREHSTKPNLCKKASCVARGICLTSDNPTVAGGEDNVLLAAPSGAPCGSEDEIQALQFCCGCVQLTELAAAPRGCQSAHCTWVCGLKGGNVARWLLCVRGISLWPVTSINKNIVKLLT